MTAFYYWNVCFDIRGVRYRAWRGYDPGDGASLQVSCKIDEQRLSARDTQPYLCGDAQIRLSRRNYEKYAAYCTNGAEGCEWFDSKDQYDQWRALGNPISDGELDQIALDVMTAALSDPSTYLAANAADFQMYLAVRGRDPSRWLAAELRKAGISYLPESKGWKKDAYGGSFPKGMIVSISSFEFVTPDHAVGALNGYCGMVCGGLSSVTLHRADGGWKVDSIKLGITF